MKNKKNLSNYIFVISTIVYVVSVFIWKKSNPDANLTPVLIIGAVILFASIIFLYGKKISKLLENTKENLTKLSEEDIRQKIIEIAHNERCNNLKKEKSYEWVKTKTINHDLIYAIQVNLNLDDEKFIVILNASEPKISPSTFDVVDSQGDIITKESSFIDREMNNKARQPTGEPNVTEKETMVDQFGRPMERVKELKYSNEEEKKEDSEL